MSKNTAPFAALSFTGAALREMAAKGHAGAIAEIARRAAKRPATTVAQKRSRGLEVPTFAYAKEVPDVAAPKAKAKAAAPKAEPAPAPTGRDTIARVRTDMALMSDRLTGIESSLDGISATLVKLATRGARTPAQA
jgi:hypothetical protein